MRSIVVMALAACAMGGCFRLSRTSPPIREYVLTGATPEHASSARNTGTLTIGLRRADVASFLSGPAIVIRRGDNEVIASEFHRWREPLDEAVNRVVASHLSGLPPVRSVETAPWATRAQHDVWVQLHVAHFEGVTASSSDEGRTDLDATWDIVRPADGRVLVRGRTALRDGSWRSGDYHALVTALDASLASLARDIANCLAGFRNDSTPPSRCGTVASTGSR